MLDEGLPGKRHHISELSCTSFHILTSLVYLLSERKDKDLASTLYHTQGGSEPQPTYIYRYADPTTPATRNCYAVALFDAHNPDILYGEVLVKPGWTQPTLSQEEVRKNHGSTPPPEPVIPLDFTIQLYDPDQQIHVTYKESSILGSTKWDFGMPQDTFRTPSGSMLDKGLSDPVAASITPKINFSWKKEKLGRELTCFYTGKSTDGLVKRRQKEPDVTCALFKSLKQLSIYEPNLSRVDLEDPKGFEVTLLLSAAVIRDVYFGNLRQAFNITEPPRKSSQPSAPHQGNQSKVHPSKTPSATAHPLRNSQPAAEAGLYTTSPQPQSPPPVPVAHPPAADPRLQWEIDQETRRLLALSEAEQREARRITEQRRQQREREAEEETRRLQKMVEQEAARAQRQRQREVEEETERLRRLYGSEGPAPNVRPAPPPPGPSVGSHNFQMPGAWPSPYPFAQATSTAQQAQTGLPSGYGPPAYPGGPPQLLSNNSGGSSSLNSRPQRTFFNIRSDNKLSKKSSSVW